MQDDEDIEIVCRSAREVAERVVALLCVVKRAQSWNLPDDELPEIEEWVKRHSLPRYFTEQERAFYNSPEITEHDAINFSWRAEAVVPLLWALREIDEMPPLNETVSLSDLRVFEKIFYHTEAFLADIQRKHNI